MAVTWKKNQWVKLITALKASRVQTVFPKPWMITGSCAFIINVINIRWKLFGNEYQWHCPSSILNLSKWLDTIWPSSQKKYIKMNAQNTNTNGLIISTKLEVLWNFGPTKISHILMYLAWLMDAKGTELFLPVKRATSCKSLTWSTQKTHW